MSQPNVFCDPITFNATKINKTIFIESFLKFFIALLMGSWMRRTFISIHQSETKTTVFGQAERKQISHLKQIVEREKFAPHAMISAGVVLVAKVDCILLMKRQK